MHSDGKPKLRASPNSKSKLEGGNELYFQMRIRGIASHDQKKSFSCNPAATLGLGQLDHTHISDLRRRLGGRAASRMVGKKGCSGGYRPGAGRRPSSAAKAIVRGCRRRIRPPAWPRRKPCRRRAQRCWPRSSRRRLLGRSRPHLRRPHRLHHRHQHHRPPSRIESWGLHGGSSLCMHAWAGDGRRRVIASRSAGDNMSGARAQYVGWGCLEWHTPRVSCGCTMPSCSSIPVSCVWTSNPHPV